MPPSAAPLPISRLMDMLRVDSGLQLEFNAAKWYQFDQLYAQYEVRVGVRACVWPIF